MLGHTALAAAVVSPGRVPYKGGVLLAKERRAFASPTTAKPDALDPATGNCPLRPESGSSTQRATAKLAQQRRPPLRRLLHIDLLHMAETANIVW